MTPSRWYRAVLAVLFVLAAVFAILSQTLQLRAAAEISMPEQQIQIGTLNPALLTLVGPTATRTPTPINLGNFVWDDIDHDGRQDAGEPGLANVTVQLWNVGKTFLYAQTTTNASGSYTLVAPLPGSYRIRVVLPGGNDTFSPKDQAGGDDTLDSDIFPSGLSAGFTSTISIASNVISMTSIDAGIIVFRTPTPTRTPTPINLGNFVWDDIDHDGRQDAGEPGLANVVVQLWNVPKTQMYAQTTTNASGSYTLVAPLPGNYRIRVLLPGGNDAFSPKDQAGGDDTLDSDINASGQNMGFTNSITIASNVISMTNIDAGIIVYRTPTPTRTPTPINIGNLVWDDLDADGRQDAGEPGLANVVVQLWNVPKTQMYTQTTTNASGIYTLVAPLPGDYRIRVVLPGGNASFSPKDQAGGDDLLDSDVNTYGLNLGFTSPISIASNVISMTHIDIGIITPLTFNPAILIPLATSTPTAQSILPVFTPIPVINTNACGSFRLTSPLDGLPNGGATFYWDTINVTGITYRIVVMDEARNVLATFDAGNSNSVSGDVSQQGIGGGFQMIVQATAIVNGQVLCSDEHPILREAGSVSAPPTPTPTRRGG